VYPKLIPKIDSRNPEEPLEKPALEFQLEWVYGYRGQIDGHGNPNLGPTLRNCISAKNFSDIFSS
jgi:hypothetical protein